MKISKNSKLLQRKVRVIMMISVLNTVKRRRKKGHQRIDVNGKAEEVIEINKKLKTWRASKTKKIAH